MFWVWYNATFVFLANFWWFCWFQSPDSTFFRVALSSPKWQSKATGNWFKCLLYHNFRIKRFFHQTRLLGSPFSPFRPKSAWSTNDPYYQTQCWDQINKPITITRRCYYITVLLDHSEVYHFWDNSPHQISLRNIQLCSC